MGLLKTVADVVKIVNNNRGAEPSFSGVGVIALGNLKGKPYVKVTWDQNSTGSQYGAQPLDLTAKMETSTLEMDATSATAVTALRGKNVSLQVTPQGTVSVDNPIIVVKDFTLLIGGEINVGDVSSMKLSGEKPAATESDIYELVTASA